MNGVAIRDVRNHSAPARYLVHLVYLDSAVCSPEPSITALTLTELSVGPHTARSDEQRTARQAPLQQAEADFEPIPFDGAAARAFGNVTASLRASERKPTGPTMR